MHHAIRETNWHVLRIRRYFMQAHQYVNTEQQQMNWITKALRCSRPKHFVKLLWHFNSATRWKASPVTINHLTVPSLPRLLCLLFQMLYHLPSIKNETLRETVMSHVKKDNFHLPVWAVTIYFKTNILCTQKTWAQRNISFAITKEHKLTLFIQALHILPTFTLHINVKQTVTRTPLTLKKGSVLRKSQLCLCADTHFDFHCTVYTTVAHIKCVGSEC
jgi:hypothetical protein